MLFTILSMAYTFCKFCNKELALTNEDDKDFENTTKC